MTSRNRLLTLVTRPICAAILLAGGWLASAGILTPPGGPVAPTMKTLSEVEPRTAINATNTPGDADSHFKITQPGSYCLTGNIPGVVGKRGIEIVASGVTLDLNGSLRNSRDEGIDVALGGINCRDAAPSGRAMRRCEKGEKSSEISLRTRDSAIYWGGTARQAWLGYGHLWHVGLR